MRDRRLCDDSASLIFKNCDEHSSFIIKRLENLIKKLISRVIFNKKSRLGHPKKKTEVKIIKPFKIWKLIVEKHKLPEQ